MSTEAIFVLGWSLVGSLVPTPGGAAGAFHAATAAGLIFLGVERETAAAISIVMHVIDFGPSVIFGFFYFVRGDINFARLRSLSSPEAVEHAVEDESITPEDNGVALKTSSKASQPVSRNPFNKVSETFCLRFTRYEVSILRLP